jgi:hypothetical protein
VGRHRGRFRKLTPQQRATLRALRELGGEMSGTPADARPLRALQRRGLVRYRRALDGSRVAVLRGSLKSQRHRTLAAKLWKWLTGE